MAISRKEEERALNVEERLLVEESRHPGLQKLADAELANLVKLGREQRDKAQTEANRRRREMRGKADPKGSTVSSRVNVFPVLKGEDFCGKLKQLSEIRGSPEQ